MTDALSPDLQQLECQSLLGGTVLPIGRLRLDVSQPRRLGRVVFVSQNLF